jgi:hypothetical protein
MARGGLHGKGGGDMRRRSSFKYRAAAYRRIKSIETRRAILESREERALELAEQAIAGLNTLNPDKRVVRTAISFLKGAIANRRNIVKDYNAMVANASKAGAKLGQPVFKFAIAELAQWGNEKIALFQDRLDTIKRLKEELDLRD